MSTPRANRSPVIHSAGFTAVEIMIVVVVLALIAAMAVPIYRDIVRGAEVNSAVSDLENVSNAIDVYVAQTGKLPDSLVDVGFEDLKDPWGRPYVYLPLQFSTEEPEAAVAEESSGMAELLEALERFGVTEEAVDSFSGGLEDYLAAEEAAGRDNPPLRALADFLAGETASGMVNFDLSSLSEDVRRGLQRKFADGGGLNSDFDFYSLGVDGKSEADISAPASLDDVVRAENGNFMGPVTLLAD